MIFVNSTKPEEVTAAFDRFPGEEIGVYYPGSGSWVESFPNKEKYLTRESASQAYSDYMNEHCPDGICDKKANRLLNVAIQTSGEHVDWSLWQDWQTKLYEKSYRRTSS